VRVERPDVRCDCNEGVSDDAASGKQNGITNSSHTMKALGSHVTFVGRYSAAKVTLSNTCCDMKM